MIHLITYSDHIFYKAKIRLNKEAISTNWFDTITLYGPEDLDDNFKNKFKNILNQKRGGGYWIWKSYIIKKKLEEMNDNDILIYLDAGCTINTNGIKRFNEYIELLNNSDKGIISFQMNHIEKKYTTKEIFKYFNISLDSDIANNGQFLGGIRIMKKNNNLINLINKEYDTLYQNSLLFTDYYNNNQESDFIDNRHEQSIFSIIRKIYGSIILTDETWFQPFGNKESLNYPFWATRKKF
tara:strand:+ start:2369 stop:3085 length:717 start_codon:yes stop_codon:yes gene_type:complete